MNRQPLRRSVLHTLLSALTRKAPEQAKQSIQPPPRPVPGDRDAWHAYWETLGQPWRTEPEIVLKRQKYLAQRRIIQPNTGEGIYPFKDIKLSRADVEWLLATHENGRGPVNWDDASQRERLGLDLRGADLRHVDLSSLPLTCLQGGLNFDSLVETIEQWADASILLEEADLAYARLEGACLEGAQLKGTFLEGAQLEEANLREAQLEEADLYEAQLEGVHLHHAQLKKAVLSQANLERAILFGAQLEEAYLIGTRLGRADLREAQLEKTHLGDIILSDKQRVGPFLADITWGNTNLAIVDWSQVTQLGDEWEAEQKKMGDGEKKEPGTRLREYQAAERANRQLSIILQSQGLNEHAGRFAYCAQVLQKTVFRLHMLQSSISLRQWIQSLGAWLFSWFLFLLAGYGYKPGRSFLAYLLVIGAFMVLYLLLDPHLVWYEALVVSMTAFHGRGFSPSTFTPGDPLSIASSIEAFVGLIIEVTFIATLTRRFFGQ